MATGEASRLTDGPVVRPGAGLVARRPPDRLHAPTADAIADLVVRSDIHVVDVATRAVTLDHARRRARSSSAPAWLPDGETIVALGHRLEGRAGSRNDIWLFAADGSDADADRRPQPVGADTT